jgi:hypothetical protein
VLGTAGNVSLGIGVQRPPSQTISVVQRMNAADTPPDPERFTLASSIRILKCAFSVRVEDPHPETFGALSHPLPFVGD